MNKHNKNKTYTLFLRRWLSVWTYALTIMLCLLPHAAAQNVASRQRPKIGLALSGGGARGFAHIGVLQWFEEHRIPVDYIAGTSMGGLVGGLYATGKSPAELRKLDGKPDWADILHGSPSSQQ